MLQLYLTKQRELRPILALLLLIVIGGGYGIFAPPAYAYERKVLMGVDASFTTCYTLTRMSLQTLQEKYPEEYCKASLIALQSLQDQIFCNPDEFLSAVEIAMNGDGYCYSVMEKGILLKYAEYPVQKYGFDEYSYKNIPGFTVEQWGPQPVKSLACSRQNATDEDRVILSMTPEEGVPQTTVDNMFATFTIDTTTKDVGLIGTVNRRETGPGREVTLKAENVCTSDPRPRPLVSLFDCRAIMPDEPGNPSLIGRMKVAPYEPKVFKVLIRKVLLPNQQANNLNLDLVNAREIEAYLNDTYKQAAIQWEVTYERIEAVVDYDIALPQDQSLLSVPQELSAEAKHIKTMAGQGISGVDAILFLVGAIVPSNIGGFAEVNGTYAFVASYWWLAPQPFVRPKESMLHTIAHELGHILGLSDLYNDPTSHDTENIMHNQSGNKLRYNQWKIAQRRIPVGGK